jgi:hypothetical protein
MRKGRATMLGLGILALVLLTGLLIFWKRGTHEEPVGVEVGGPQADDQVVTLHLRLSDKKFGTDKDVESCQALEIKLDELLATASVGLVDGNEIGGGECVIFMYGQDADKLFAAVERTVRSSPLAKGGWVSKRYGSVDDDKARETRLNL